MTRDCICSAQTQFKDLFSSVVVWLCSAESADTKGWVRISRGEALTKNMVESGRKWVFLIGIMSRTKAKWSSKEI